MVVVHGGDDGEINFGEGKGKFIFECSLEENRSFETAFTLPTLQDIFELVQKQMLVNIEIKVPGTESIK